MAMPTTDETIGYCRHMESDPYHWTEERIMRVLIVWHGTELAKSHHYKNNGDETTFIPPNEIECLRMYNQNMLMHHSVKRATAFILRELDPMLDRYRYLESLETK